MTKEIPIKRSFTSKKITSIHNKFPRRIALLVDTSTGWGRSIVRGVHQQVLHQYAWQLFLEPRGVGEVLRLPPSWAGDGVIARVGDELTARHLLEREIPVVNVSAIQIPSAPFHRVCSDLEAAGRMAADYLIDRGFKHFAYLSLHGLEYVSRHRDAYERAIAAAGYPCIIHGVQVRDATQVTDWNLRIDELAEWIKILPKPVAILTWSGGNEVIHACRHANIAIPEDVAVLSGSDDDLLCELSDIPISAVKQAAEQIGRQAAIQLQHLMTSPSSGPIADRLIAPLEVITRQSTDTLAVQDACLGIALTYIRENIDVAFQVDQVALKAGLSRRVLERRFMEVLKRSPAEYIRRARLDRAKLLLAKTDLSIEQVAESSGFGSPEYFAQMLRADTGMSPRRYRHKLRSG